MESFSRDGFRLVYEVYGDPSNEPLLLIQLDELGSVDVPTLVLVGAQNGEWFVNLAKETATRIDDAEFQILSGGSDPSNLTVTAAFDESVLSFLEETG